MSHELRAIAQSSRLAAHSKKGRDVSKFVEFCCVSLFFSQQSTDNGQRSLSLSKRRALPSTSSGTAELSNFEL